MQDPLRAYESSSGLQRILVVDDDPAIQRLLKDKLEGAGYEVWTASSGQADRRQHQPVCR